MPSLENHIARTLGEARECLTVAEITERLNAEFGRKQTPNAPYQVGEIESHLRSMSNVYAKGDKYCLKREDASQAAARIVREATKDK